MVGGVRAEPRLSSGAVAPARRDAVRGLGWAASLAAVVLVPYVAIYPARGITVALGSDAPFYTWWARAGAVLGLGAPGRDRPGIVGLLAALAGGLGQPPAAVVAAAGPLLAVATVLALAAVLRTAGADRARAWLAGSLAGAFLALLAPGWLSTLAFGALFLAALACVAGGDGSAASTLAGALLFGAAGLVHPQFLALAGAVMAGGLVGLVPGLLRARALGLPLRGTAFGRVLAAASAGAGLAAGGTWASSLARAADLGHLDISRDAALRRLGLPHLVTRSFADKLRHDFPWYRAAAGALGGLAPAVAWPWARGRDAGRRPRGGAGALRTGRLGPLRRAVAALASVPEPTAFVLGAGVAWAAATVAGVAALLAGLQVPGQRLAAFCLPVPVALAVAVARLARSRSPVARAVATLGTVAFAAAFWTAWAREPVLISPEGARQARAAAGALAGRPPGTALVVVADSSWPRPGFQVVRSANYLRAAVPGDRVGDVHLFVGSVGDLLEGRPTETGNPEHDRLSAASWAEVRPRLRRGAVVVALEWFDPVAYRAARALPGSRPLGPGAVLLPGSAPPAAPAARAGPGPGALAFSPWVAVWLAPLLLALLAGVGWGWARPALPRAEPFVRAALAPSLGAAALTLAAVAVDALGLRLGEGGAPLSLAVAAALPWLARAGNRRRARGPLAG
jgi:hypothetical protein